MSYDRRNIVEAWYVNKQIHKGGEGFGNLDGQGVLFSATPYRKQTPMSQYASRSFWSEAIDKAIKQAANTAVVLIGADTVFDIVNFDWANLASIVAGSAVLSVLLSVGSAQRK